MVPSRRCRGSARWWWRERSQAEVDRSTWGTGNDQPMWCDRSQNLTHSQKSAHAPLETIYPVEIPEADLVDSGFLRLHHDCLSGNRCSPQPSQLKEIQVVRTKFLQGVFHTTPHLPAETAPPEHGSHMVFAIPLNDFPDSICDLAEVSSPNPVVGSTIRLEFHFSVAHFGPSARNLIRLCAYGLQDPTRYFEADSSQDLRLLRRRILDEPLGVTGITVPAEAAVKRAHPIHDAVCGQGEPRSFEPQLEDPLIGQCSTGPVEGPGVVV